MKREMLSISVGARADQYRANTHSRLSMGWLNHQQKKCAGPCKMPRSLTQFAPGDDLCAKCRLRAA
jgi:hypothetical protein